MPVWEVDGLTSQPPNLPSHSRTAYYRRCMRDDFPEETKRTIAQRVNYICSRCEALTAGPRIDGSKALNVGVAAHITSASPGGPRYDKSLTPEERRHADNGVWLCQTCGKLLDNDEARFTKETLREWKERAEGRALESIGKTGGPHRKVRLQARVGVLVPHVELLVGEGNRIYKEIIGDPVQLQHLADYQLRIEQWRTRVGNFCDQELPGSGARTLALPKDGQLGVGPIGFELTRLVSALNGLKEIIHSIESYVSRSQPLEQPPAAGDSKGQRRVAITTLLNRVDRSTEVGSGWGSAVRGSSREPLPRCSQHYSPALYGA